MVNACFQEAGEGGKSRAGEARNHNRHAHLLLKAARPRGLQS
jgi:hypothetical protein